MKVLLCPPVTSFNLDPVGKPNLNVSERRLIQDASVSSRSSVFRSVQSFKLLIIFGLEVGTARLNWRPLAPQASDDLRLLGNDAAHIESQESDKVGQEEAEVGIEFTKEVLKAVYQYSALLNRLKNHDV